MICKYCNAEIEDGLEVCPNCDMNLTEESTEEILPVEEETAEETLAAEENEEESAEEDTSEEDTDEESDDEDELEELEEDVATPKKKVWPLVLKIAGAVLILGVVGTVLVSAILAAFGITVIKLTLPKNDIFNKESYTVSDEKIAKKRDKVVATAGDAELTNAQLQIYYRMQVLDFVNYFGSYASSIGLDVSKPLSEQTSYYDETMSWEQYFIDAAIKTWQTYQAIALEAEENGFALDAEMEAELAKIPEMMEEQAASGGYESGEAMVKELLGNSCTVADYQEYIYLSTVANEYYAQKYEQMQPTDADIEAYFAENEEVLAESGITRDAGLVSSVRHILICPKEEESTEETTAATEPTTTTDATEPTTEESGYTEAQWAACYAEAERILQEWKDGEATEESFAELVPIYSEDGGSLQTGGLYENIDPTSSYVENFLAWSVDMSRQPGDTGIVQTEYGYHIMYFVSGSPYWIEVVRNQMVGMSAEDFMNAAKEKYPVKVNYKKIVLSELNLA